VSEISSRSDLSNLAVDSGVTQCPSALQLGLEKEKFEGDSFGNVGTD